MEVLLKLKSSAKNKLWPHSWYCSYLLSPSLSNCYPTIPCTVTKSLHLKGRFLLQHLLEFLILDLPISRIVHRSDQLLYVNWQIELLLDDPDQHLPINVAWFVGWTPDGCICVKCGLVIIPVDLGLPLLAVNVQNLLEVDNPLVAIVQLRYQFAQLEFFEMQLQPLKGSLQVVYANLPVVIVLKILHRLPAKANVLLSQNILHSSIFTPIIEPKYKKIEGGDLYRLIYVSREKEEAGGARRLC